MSSTALQVHDGRAALAHRADAAEYSFADLLRFAQEIVPTGMLPDWITTPGQAVAIILTGRELGMQPMRALRSLQMVKGKVVENADSQFARFKADGGRGTFLELSETRGVLALRHPNGDEHTETFTFADAERAGLTKPSQKGEPSMYLKHPKAMLRSRTITAGLKSIGWEGGVGAYDPDEAAAFTPPAATGPISTATVPSVDQSTPQMTLDTATALPFPFQRGKPVHGRPLGDLKSDLLQSVAAWITEQQRERNDTGFHADTLAAIAVILEGRQKDQTRLELDGEPGTPTSATHAVPAPGLVADALAPNAPASDSVHALTTRLYTLLAHPSVTAADRERVKRAMVNGWTHRDLAHAVQHWTEHVARADQAAALVGAAAET